MKSKIGDETKSSNVSELEALEAIQDRVLWLSTRMIDFANSDRPNLVGKNTTYEMSNCKQYTKRVLLGGVGNSLKGFARIAMNSLHIMGSGNLLAPQRSAHAYANTPCINIGANF
jgi:hypothetical protein